jgi:hypothetical protein
MRQSARRDMQYHGRDQSLSLTLPPLGALFFKSDG